MRSPRSAALCTPHMPVHGALSSIARCACTSRARAQQQHAFLARTLLARARVDSPQPPPWRVRSRNTLLTNRGRRIASRLTGAPSLRLCRCHCGSARCRPACWLAPTASFCHVLAAALLRCCRLAAAFKNAASRRSRLPSSGKRDLQRYSDAFLCCYMIRYKQRGAPSSACA